MLEIGLNAVLVSRVSVNDVPTLRHGLAPQSREQSKSLAKASIEQSDDDADDDQRSANNNRVVHELLLIGPRDTLHLGLDRSEILLGAGEETRLLVLLGLRSLLVLLGNGLLGLNLGVGGSFVGRCRLLSLLLVLLVGHLGYLRAMRLYMSKP